MCSVSTRHGRAVGAWRSTMSCHQTSRPGLHRSPVRIAEAPDDQDVLDGWRSAQRRVGGGLEVDGLAAPPAAVGGDEQPRLGVVDAARQRLGGEAAEDDRVRRADAGAGEHGDGQLRDHGHVDGDAVAGADAQLLERVGGLLDLAVQVGVGERPRVAGLADPVVGDLVAEAGVDVAVEAVVATLSLPPSNQRAKGGSQSRVRAERLHPAQLLAGQVGPEALVVVLGHGVELGPALAWALNAGSGGNSRPSAMRFSISGPPAAATLLVGHASASSDSCAIPVGTRGPATRARYPLARSGVGPAD